MPRPLISIITATYNRSNILTYSIQSALGQTYTDWELLVIGDCCTDDTDAVVAAFNDPRITFFNLEENFGEQSEPNNVGMRLAKGDFIAFLNHDDFWFPDHLEFSLNFLHASGADIVLASGFIDHHENKSEFFLSGIVPEKYGYHPSRVFVSATNWLFKRELVKKVGFWRPAKDLYTVPSHDWLKRAYELGSNILPTKHFTVIALPSSSRKNAYKDRTIDKAPFYSEQLNTNPHFREQIISENLYKCFEVLYYDENTYYWRFFTKKIKNVFIKLGLNTIEFELMRRFGKGGLLRSYRKRRGLNLN
ncbi:glycosyltransferase family 2 protein [Dyadobacter arcticus]|uniref:Glycosyltransferase involved in cell wall biosynthesis n=1 Tax=Dyadobacter arcticus TaxID=1078754 RepID=A0ABX0USP1_9BACT|nr:glycosyltransferase family 2 protein [Dyadobacter arcticus]NIJ55991.1 glycosyltransferase involved in cell wall biosynthesis [Dyadobacter arcticus]